MKINSNNKYIKLVIENWFQIVVIFFLITFYFQLNRLVEISGYISNGYVTVDSFSSGAIRDLKGVR